MDKRGVTQCVWRNVRPPTGRSARRLVGGICLISGLGRIGLFSFVAETIIPSQFYGWLMISAAAALWATADCRLSILGRTAAIWAFATLAALAIDIFVHGTPGSTMSGWILTYLSYVTLGEIVSQRDH